MRATNLSLRHHSFLAINEARISFGPSKLIQSATLVPVLRATIYSTYRIFFGCRCGSTVGGNGKQETTRCSVAPGPVWTNIELGTISRGAPDCTQNPACWFGTHPKTRFFSVLETTSLEARGEGRIGRDGERQRPLPGHPTVPPSSFWVRSSDRRNTCVRCVGRGGPLVPVPLKRNRRVFGSKGMSGHVKPTANHSPRCHSGGGGLQGDLDEGLNHAPVQRPSGASPADDTRLPFRPVVVKQPPTGPPSIHPSNHPASPEAAAGTCPLDPLLFECRRRRRPPRHCLNDANLELHSPPLLPPRGIVVVVVQRRFALLSTH